MTLANTSVDRMDTESPIRITETSRTWTSLKGTSAHRSSSSNIAIDELGLLLKTQNFQVSGRALVPSRSGSAPPTIEGSIAAANNIITDQNFDFNANLASIKRSIDSYVLGKKLHADPADVAHSSNRKLNPRATPPLIPKVHLIGTAGYSRKVTSSDEFGGGSLSMSHSKLPTLREEPKDERSTQLTPAKFPDPGMSFLSRSEAIPGQLEGVSGTTQKDMSNSKSPVYKQDPSLIAESLEEVVTRDTESLVPMPSAEDMQQSSNTDPATSILISSTASASTSALSKAPLHKRQSSPVDSHVGDHINSSATDTGPSSIDSNMNSTSSSSSNSNQVHSHYHNIVREQVPHEQRYRFEVQTSQFQMSSQGLNHSYVGSNQYFHGPPNYSEMEVHPASQSSGFGPPLYATAVADNMNSSTLLYQNLHPSSFFSPQYSPGGYTFQSEGIPPYIAGYVPQAVVPVSFDAAASQYISPQTSPLGGITSQGFHLQHLNSYYGQFGFQMQPSLLDPLRLQYLQRPFADAYGRHGQFDHLPPRVGATENPIIAIDLQKGSGFSAFPADQKFQNQGSTGDHYFNPGTECIPYYVGSPRDAGLLQYPSTAVASPVLPGSPLGGSNFIYGTNELRFSPRLARNPGISPGWVCPRGPDGRKSLSFLEELKSGKGRKLELSNIVGHVIEFSGDQHGSRFIQQLLENCSLEEKESVFKEVLPNTSKLMTDVFGNYVIQKFFDYGSLEQRRQLANQLEGQILPLSLQMYGCRVIQKALDVIEPEQKIKLVHELDGHVLRCVRDQNGNHVIQKCIETIPIHQIEFIISSFHGEVAQLSTHPYGCRVIQRVLEHCKDDLQSQFIVDEILESFCALAQDQYGNYVTQHVLERGNAREKRLILSKLSGHIVQLSQHKFASNVVEKCLDYGDSTSLETVIAEIIGQEDGNDNLLAMVKDQYGNYVIQKIIHTCSGDQRTMLLYRISAHLSSLKKYTYGKHIAARFEQLYGEELRSQDPDTLTE